MDNKIKALEIIIKYNIRPSNLIYMATYDEYLYNMSIIFDDVEIMNEEEFYILKEVLNEQSDR